MSLTSANLVGYMRAEFAKASRLRIALFFLQLAVAIPAAVAVVIPDDEKKTLYVLAREQLPVLRRDFFQEPALPFTPFHSLKCQS